MSRGLRRFGPVAVWAAVIFYLSSLRSPPGSGSVPDWLSHGVAYLVLAVLLCHALHAEAGWAGAGRLIAAVALATAYGVTDEAHQSLVPGRDASAADVGKDFGGSAVGALGYAQWRRRGSRAAATGSRRGAPSAGSPARRRRGR